MGATMTLSITNRPAPAWLTELAHGRDAYEELLGWPVSVQVGDRLLILAVGQTVEAVTVPASLGAVVRAELGIGPIVADPDGARWTFLTRPVNRPAELAHERIDVAPRGSYVTVPTDPQTSSGPGWRWIEPPSPRRPLLPTNAVLRVLRRLAERQDMAG
jgi:hypothetical protein